MDIRGWLLFVRDWFLLLALGTVLAGAAAFVLSSLLPKTYEAETTLLVGQSLSAANPDYSQLLASQLIAQTYAEVATARRGLEDVITSLGLEATPEQLRQAVEARAPANSTLIVITAQHEDPGVAADIANEVAATLISGVVGGAGVSGPTQEDLIALEAEIDGVNADILALQEQAQLNETQQARLQDLRDQAQALRDERSDMVELLTGSSNRLTVIEPAIPADQPVAPRVLLNTAVGAFLGLLISAIAAYGFDSMVRPEAPTQGMAQRVAAPISSTRSR
jgi:polysaccharide biosynthesis transport protein